jgi:hypothetical protein
MMKMNLKFCVWMRNENHKRELQEPAKNNSKKYTKGNTFEK